MKKIGDASFFRIVDRLLAAGTTRVPKVHWLINGVDWRRDRHSYAGQRHGFTLEHRSVELTGVCGAMIVRADRVAIFLADSRS